MTSGIYEQFSSLSAADQAAFLKRLTEDPAAMRQVGLSYAQRRLWFLEQLDDTNNAYSVPAAFHCHGPLDITAFHTAYQQICQRHEILRTRLLDAAGEPVQLPATTTPPFTTTDLRHLPPHQRHPHTLLHNETQQPFTITNAPLTRCHIITINDNEHLIIITMHHTVTDGWSSGILYRELSHLYNAATTNTTPNLPELPIQYTDYAAWQNDTLTGEWLHNELTYWRTTLHNAPTTLDLPLDHPRPPRQTFHGNTITTTLPPHLTHQIHHTSQQHGMTPFMLLLATYAVLLHHYTGQDDILIGAPAAGRTRPELDNLIGLFVNTIVLRANLTNNPTFHQLLTRIHRTALDAYTHQDLPLDKIIEDLTTHRTLDRNPLFQAFFSYEKTTTTPDLQLHNLTTTPLESPNHTAKFDLDLGIEEHPDGTLEIGLNYATDLFDTTTAHTMLHHLHHLLTTLTTNPHTPLDAITPPVTHRTIAGSGGSTPVVADPPAVTQTGRPPQSSTEKAVAGIWEELLGRPVTSVSDNFFSLGGQSLLVLRLVARVREVMDLKLDPAAAFETPTVGALAAAIDQARGSDITATQPIPPVDHSRPLPLSYAQRRLWFLEQLDDTNNAYSVPAAFHCHGPLDITAFHTAYQQICQRHEILRTRLLDAAGEPVQLPATTTPPFTTTDLRHLPPHQRHPHTLLHNETQQPFTITNAPLTRCHIITINDNEHLIIITMHHTVTDGWSSGILYRELSHLYNAATTNTTPNLPELPIQYTDYAAWQNDTLTGEWLHNELTYWRTTLHNAPTTLDLPLDHPRPPRQTFHGNTITTTLPPHLTHQIHHTSQQHGMTPFMLLLATYAVLLHHYTGQDDILIGAPAAGRTRPELDNLIGLFVNTIVLRANLTNNPTFHQLLTRIHRTALDAYTHQDLPLDKIIEDLTTHRTLDRNPLFQAFFSYEKTTTTPDLQLHNLTTTPLESPNHTAKFDLDLGIEEHPDGTLEIGLNYATDLFDTTTAHTMLHHLHHLLTTLTTNPHTPLDAIALLPVDEQATLLRRHHIPAPDSTAQGLQELVQRQAARTPDVDAVVRGTDRLTYRQLDQQADTLARRLHAYGVGPDVPVGICLPRTPRLVVAILAVLKAGGCYLPLDASYPADRVQFMLADSAASLVLTDGTLTERFAGHHGEIICLDDLPPADLPTAAPPRTNGPDDLAYILYTSGSTGRPKGVAVAHRSVITLAESYRQLFTEDEVTCVLGAASVCFDASILELFGTLSRGGTLVLVDTVLDLATTGREITMFQTVPSLMAELLRTGGVPDSVQTLCIGGEPLPPHMVERIYTAGRIQRIINIYGPTEDTVDSAWSEIRRGCTHPTIGRPVPGTYCYVLDPYGRPVPDGVPGELHLGGDGLARGYLNRPALTAERFLPDPFRDTPGQRMYRTGDLVRYLPDGDLDFLGRVDRQVKLRGMRIEPGEIEKVVTSQPGITDAAVVVLGGSAAGRLVAYLVCDSDYDETSLRRALRRELPDHLVPANFVELDTLPVTPNGKLDTSALPEPIQESTVPTLPGNATEQRVAKIWESILERSPIGVHDDFFALGGHSLAALRIISRLNQEFDTTLTVSVLFEAPTIAALAPVLTSGGSAPDTPLVSVRTAQREATAIVLVHAVGGSVLGYSELVRHLAPQAAVYGLEAPGLHGGATPLASVPQLAGHYIDALRERGLTDNLILLGWSMGGAVAYEMAAQLATDGALPPPLVLLDSVLPSSSARPDPVELLEEYARFLADAGATADELPLPSRAQLADSQGVEYLWRWARECGLLGDEIDLTRLRWSLDVFRANVAALDTYHPGPAASPTLYLAASAQGRTVGAARWRDLLGPGIVVREVGGGHYGMLTEPHHRHVADEINQWIGQQH